MCNSLKPHGLYSPWNSPCQNTGVGSLYLYLLQGIFPTQGLNPGLLHCRRILYQLSHKGSPRILEWEPIPSPVDLLDPGIKLGSPISQADSLPTELSGKPDGKESACNEGDLGSIPGSGRSPGEGNGNPLLYSCLENSMDRGRLQSMGSQRVGHNCVTNTFFLFTWDLNTWGPVATWASPHQVQKTKSTPFSSQHIFSATPQVPSSIVILNHLGVISLTLNTWRV